MNPFFKLSQFAQAKVNRPLYVVSLSILTSFLFVSCDVPELQQPNIMVLTIEGLGHDKVVCPEEGDTLTTQDRSSEGFEILCRESVRYTHALTPSVLSQPALTSLMTGLEPFEHQVHNNGAHFLNEKFVTLAEEAVKKGYRTAFFSGGAPIFRKSGLDQGFEIFEDNIALQRAEFYRPAQKQIDLFLKWHDFEVKKKLFFSTLYFTDLQFPFFPTLTESGHEREKSEKSQRDEISESLVSLFSYLKKNNLWNNTAIVLVGLNGSIENAKAHSFRALNLNTINNHVALLIKPPRRAREESKSWLISTPVTLSDVGSSLFDLLGSEVKGSGASLIQSFLRPYVDWPKERLLRIESGWASWRGLGPTRLAFRKDYYLLLYNEIPIFFNTLTDRGELSPIFYNDTTDMRLKNIMSQLNSSDDEKWLNKYDEEISILSLAIEALSPKGLSNESFLQLSFLAQRKKSNSQLADWLLRSTLSQKNWQRLEELGLYFNRRDWQYLAQKNNNQSPMARVDGPAPRSTSPQEFCFFALLKMNKDTFSNDCQDELSRNLMAWLSAKGRERQENEEKFYRAYFYYKTDERVAILNYQVGLTWDVSLRQPQEVSPVDLFFALPEHKSKLQRLSRRWPQLFMYE